MAKFLRRSWFQLLIFALLLSGCNEKPEYHWEAYTEDEMRTMFQENRELFDKLVEVIVSEQDFFEKGRRDEYADAILMSPYDDEMEWFSENGRKTIVDFFALKPYMIAYDDDQRFVEITFIASEEWESGVFFCWVKPEAPGIHGGGSELEEYLCYMEQDYVTVGLGENWYFYK